MTYAQLSVITAAHPAAYQWLREAGASLLDQTVPLQWIVVADDFDTNGVTNQLATLPEQLRKRTTVLATGTLGLGAAVARTVALTEVRTPWLSILDADDQWLPGGLDTLLAAATTRNVSWAVGRCDELTPAGRRSHRPDSYVPNQYFWRGETPRVVETGLLPWHACVMVARAAAVRAAGGWPPFPVAEDFALAVALGALTHGFAVDQTVFLYRKWGAIQTTEKPSYAALRAYWRPLAIKRAAQLAAHYR